MQSNIIYVDFAMHRRLTNLRKQLVDLDKLIAQQTSASSVDRIRLEALCFHKAAVERQIRQIECPIIPSAIPF